MSDTTKLEQVLSTFGARTDAWPDDARRELEAVLAKDSAARRLVAEAAALEAVLAAAPKVPAARHEALAASILTLARGSEQVVGAPAGNVVRLDARRPGPVAAERDAEKHDRMSKPAAIFPRSRSNGQSGWRSRNSVGAAWPSAGVLAASLVLGIWLGTSDLTSTISGEVAVALAGTNEVDEDGTYFPLFDVDTGFEVSL